MWDGAAFVQWMTDNRDKIYERQPLSRGVKEECQKIDSESGYALVSFELTEEHLNFLSRVHGGIVALMLDEVSGIASIAYAGHRFKGTVESKISFFRSLRAGKVVAEATVVHASSSMLFVEATVSDENGQIAAKSTSTFAVAKSPPNNDQSGLAGGYV
ncbi:PaaI family thioesterase [Sphingopyxis sp. SE2]|uniref:PaaI family thioesterase n=1 Tax=Sphingopyxis sp. SE2 TaxID=1586240 RepID=UPI0028C34D37|nr:PaaI family thioesterase [Sphingopyxis sp. SE2]MDT7531074.1 PaaI family thioesterase [Sphingopyxis sp. SE2]